jgi:nitrite reductase (NADH) large subunit
MAKYVIVGASAAGIAAVEAIRKVDQAGDIVVITEEACAHYSRPMISDLVSGKADVQKMNCKNEDFWKTNNARSTYRQKSHQP